jgi:hypothetical protein
VQQVTSCVTKGCKAATTGDACQEPGCLFRGGEAHGEREVTLRLRGLHGTVTASRSL